MACFTATVVEAAIVTIVEKIVKKKEKINTSADVQMDGAEKHENKRGFSRKLAWLKNMLWGGSALLAFEHVWHGEVVPYFPFLTAAGNPEDAAVMLHEIATVGVSMCVLVTAVWGVMVGISMLIEKRADKEPQTVSEEA